MSVGDVNMSEAADEDQDLALGKQSSVVKVYPWQSKFAFSCKKGTTIRIYIFDTFGCSDERPLYVQLCKCQ